MNTGMSTRLHGNDVLLQSHMHWPFKFNQKTHHDSSYNYYKLTSNVLQIVKLFQACKGIYSLYSHICICE